MKRLCGLLMLLAVGSSAQAGESISFSFAGHRIHVEAARNCRSTSCASISVSGLYESRRRWDHDDERDAAPPPALAAAPAQMIPPPIPSQPAKPVVTAAPSPVASIPAVGFETAAAAGKPVAALPPLPPVPPPPQAQAPKPVSQPCVSPAPEKPREVLPPPSALSGPPPMVKALHEEDSSDTPLGDWQTEAKGIVRIAQCGKALCGYALNASSNDKGETVLINMKPKSDSQWSGSVYSRDSGDTYYGTMGLKAPNTLHVEACAFGHFYCTGNNWSRISGKTERLISSRQISTEPRS
jgi:hypothetical protein